MLIPIPHNIIFCCTQTRSLCVPCLAHLQAAAFYISIFVQAHRLHAQTSSRPATFCLRLSFFAFTIIVIIILIWILCLLGLFFGFVMSTSHSSCTILVWLALFINLHLLLLSYYWRSICVVTKWSILTIS